MDLVPAPPSSPSPAAAAAKPPCKVASPAGLPNSALSFFSFSADLSWFYSSGMKLLVRKKKKSRNIKQAHHLLLTRDRV
jgi:hypothetical protein